VRLVLDAGAFIALERGDRAMWRRVRQQVVNESRPITHGGVVAQVWRGGSGRQAPLARALAFTDIVGLDHRLGRDAGVLLSRSGASDAIDAAVVALAGSDDQIATSDPDDLLRLIAVSGRHIDVLTV